MLTPIELQGKSFKTGFGYDKKDVESFFKDVIKNFEILYKENLELNDKINVLSEGVQYYKSIEKTLQKALVLAQKAAADTENAASEKARVLEEEAIQKAKKIEEDAKMKADKITSEALHSVKQLQFEATKELHQIQLDVASLLQQYETYKIQYKQMIAAQLELLESESFKIDLTSLQSINRKSQR